MMFGKIAIKSSGMIWNQLKHLFFEVNFQPFSELNQLNNKAPHKTHTFTFEQRKKPC